MFKNHDLTETRIAIHALGILKENELMKIYFANLIGQTAKQLILKSELKGKVLAVFSNTIFLVCDSGEVIWIVTEPSFMHMRCIYLSEGLPEINAETSFSISGNSLEFEQDQFVLFGQAGTWEHKSIEPASISPLSRLKENYQQLSNNILGLSNFKGFGHFLLLINRWSKNMTNQLDFESNNPILINAWQMMPGLWDACLNFNLDGMIENGEKLIGLGPGLTPSGDDFLGGLFFSLDQLRKSYPDQIQYNSEHFSEFIEKVKKQTNLISYTLFKDLFLGNAVEPLHQFMDALLTGQPTENMIFYLRKLIQIGYSTGWDQITGVLCGLLVTLNY
jgi:hypothetical protein